MELLIEDSKGRDGTWFGPFARVATEKILFEKFLRPEFKPAGEVFVEWLLQKKHISRDEADVLRSLPLPLIVSLR